MARILVPFAPEYGGRVLIRQEHLLGILSICHRLHNTDRTRTGALIGIVILVLVIASMSFAAVRIATG
jgi:hypothetical protein